MGGGGRRGGCCRQGRRRPLPPPPLPPPPPPSLPRGGRWGGLGEEGVAAAVDGKRSWRQVPLETGQGARGGGKGRGEGQGERGQGGAMKPARGGGGRGGCRPSAQEDGSTTGGRPTDTPAAHRRWDASAVKGPWGVTGQGPVRGGREGGGEGDPSSQWEGGGRGRRGDAVVRRVRLHRNAGALSTVFSVKVFAIR